MKSFRKFLVWFLSISFISCSNESDFTAESDTLSFQSFVDTVYQYNELCANDQFKFNEQQAVSIVRTYNSISYYHIEFAPKFSKFIHCFEHKLLQEVTTCLECELSIGMGYYCEKSDVFIGGGVIFHTNSYYRIHGEYFQYLEQEIIE